MHNGGPVRLDKLLGLPLTTNVVMRRVMTAFDRAIAHFGSGAALAAQLGCTQQHVSLLKRGRRRVTAELAVRVEAVTGGVVAAHELRPDVFRPPRVAPPAPASEAAA